MNNATIVNGKLAIEIPAQAPEENVSAAFHTFAPNAANYPAKIKMYFEKLDRALPTIYGIGNPGLLDLTITTVATSQYSSPASRNKAKYVSRQLGKHNECILLGSQQGIDFGIATEENQVNPQTGEVTKVQHTVWHGLALHTLDAGGSVIVFQAKGLEMERFEQLNAQYPNRVLFLSTVNPSPLVEQKGSIDVAIVRNICVSALSDAYIVIECNVDGGTHKTAMHALLSGAMCFTINQAKGIKPIRVKGENGQWRTKYIDNPLANPSLLEFGFKVLDENIVQKLIASSPAQA